LNFAIRGHAYGQAPKSSENIPDLHLSKNVITSEIRNMRSFGGGAGLDYTDECADMLLYVGVKM